MIFLSRDRSPSLLMIPGYEEIVKTVHGNVPVIKKPKWLKFTAFGANASIHAPGLPVRKEGENAGRAQGYLDTEIAARENDLPESEIITFLESHPWNGVEYIAAKKEEAQNGLSIEIFEPEGEGGFYCKLCEQSLQSAQAVNGHKTSKKHQIREEEFLENFREQLRKNTNQKQK